MMTKETISLASLHRNHNYEHLTVSFHGSRVAKCDEDAMGFRRPQQAQCHGFPKSESNEERRQWTIGILTNVLCPLLFYYCWSFLV